MVQALSDPVISMTRACTLGLWGRLDPPCRIIYLPEGLDLRQWHTSVSGGRIRQELGITSETPVVGFVGRLDPWKGLDVFLRAAALVADRFPDALFLISGDSPEGFEPYRQRMMNLARDLGIGRRVLFLGWKYRLDDMPEFMGALDVFSHTATHPEPFGLVLIEAMSMGRPVVASRAGGPLEIVQDGKTGFLTPASDAAAHAQAVCRLLENRQLAQEMGQAGRRRVEEEYSLEVFSRRVERIYQEAMFPPVEPIAADRKSVP
jgi:glycosyltransferase involved in cell wall biosynthesis